MQFTLFWQNKGFKKVLFSCPVFQLNKPTPDFGLKPVFGTNKSVAPYRPMLTNSWETYETNWTSKPRNRIRNRIKDYRFSSTHVRGRTPNELTTFTLNSKLLCNISNLYYKFANEKCSIGPVGHVDKVVRTGLKDSAWSGTICSIIHIEQQKLPIVNFPKITSFWALNSSKKPR